MDTPMENIIEIKNFKKSFGNKVVIKDLSFEVKKGEIFAFLGANGSGKTTTLRTLLGIYQPDEGELTINGQKYSPEMSSILGYLPEERGLYATSKVLETLVYFGELKGLSKEDATQRGKDYLQRVGLSDKERLEIKKLSSGQQQKIQLGITILNKPQLLILDEPTKGLDPVNRELLLEILLELNKEGSTIIFSTHQMEEAEKIADRLLMIKDGTKALYGDVDKVKESFGDNIIHLSFKGKFPRNDKLYSAKVENYYAEITPNENVTSDQILKSLIASDIDIKKFEISTPSLNEIFIKVVTDSNQ